MPKLPKKRDGELVKFKDEVIPFTYWPDNFVKYGTIRTYNCWQCVRSFIANAESDLDDKKFTVIHSYVKQSEDFYRASVNSSLQIKPLLLYYSYLNLAKAFILIREKDVFEQKEIHGLSSTYTERYRGTTSLKCKIQRPSKSRVSIVKKLNEKCNFPSLKTNKIVTMDELFYEIVSIHDSYIVSKEKDRVFFPIKLTFLQSKNKKTVWIKGDINTQKLDKQTKERLAKFVSNSKSWKRVYSDNRSILTIESIKEFPYSNTPKDQLRKLVEKIRHTIYSEQIHDGYKYYLCCKESFHAQVVSNFIIMFILGSLVRYKPQLVEKIQNEWIIHEYLSTQALQFTYLLSSGIIKNEIIPGPLPL